MQIQTDLRMANLDDSNLKSFQSQSVKKEKELSKGIRDSSMKTKPPGDQSETIATPFDKAAIEQSLTFTNNSQALDNKRRSHLTSKFINGDHKTLAF